MCAQNIMSGHALRIRTCSRVAANWCGSKQVIARALLAACSNPSQAVQGTNLTKKQQTLRSPNNILWAVCDADIECQSQRVHLGSKDHEGHSFLWTLHTFQAIFKKQTAHGYPAIYTFLVFCISIRGSSPYSVYFKKGIIPLQCAFQ